ncbi:serine/threonine-protein kinase [Promicromonospora citrea]|uniref:serine/threonine-protein kinase n=1 Tax=Promicromonospora citrea TaxID=43677 RepID=UPI0036138D58
MLLSRLGHPNVVRVFDAGTVTTAAGERGWFTMEYVAGGNLDDVRTAHTAGPLPVADTVEILRQLCAGLAAAHGEDPPIVHRDLTPWNVLVGQDGRGIRVRIGDFGLARRAQPGLTGGEGTLAFMAPEALRYGAGSSTAADVYSVGVLAYLLLTDVLPHRDTRCTAPSGGATRRALAVQPCRRRRARRPGAARARPRPARRPQDAAAFAADLAQWREAA